MNILFDQGTPVPLRRYLARHTASTAYEQGWSTLTNGELLDAAEHAGYQVFVTTDQKLQYQQHLTERRIAVVGLLSRILFIRSTHHHGCSNSRSLYITTSLPV